MAALRDSIERARGISRRLRRIPSFNDRMEHLRVFTVCLDEVQRTELLQPGRAARRAELVPRRDGLSARAPRAQRKATRARRSAQPSSVRPCSAAARSQAMAIVSSMLAVAVISFLCSARTGS